MNLRSGRESTSAGADPGDNGRGLGIGNTNGESHEAPLPAPPPPTPPPKTHTEMMVEMLAAQLKGPNMARGGVNSLFKNLQIN